MAAIARRAARRRARRLLLPPTGVETRYVALLSSGFREIHRHVMAFLRPRLGEIAHGTAKTDAAPNLSHDLSDLVQILAKELQKKILPDFDAMTRRVAANNARAVRELGVNVLREQPGMQALLAQARLANLSLIRNASADYVNGVRKVLDAPDAWGLTVEELADRLVERGGVAESRAELIARDQTLKINGSLNELRQRSAGVDEYVWSGSLDERERPEHLANEGKRFSWLRPPENTGHPSDEVNCRCVAIPVIPELEGED